MIDPYDQTTVAQALNRAADLLYLPDDPRAELTTAHELNNLRSNLRNIADHLEQED